MGMTIVEKILASRAGVATVTPGDLVVVDVDTAVLVDNAFLPNVWREVTQVFDPSKIVIVFDHRAPALRSPRRASPCRWTGIRTSFRYFTPARHRPRWRHKPRCRRRACLCAPRHGIDLFRFAYLQRRRVELRRARDRSPRHDLFHHYRQELVPAGDDGAL